MAPAVNEIAKNQKCKKIRIKCAFVANIDHHLPAAQNATTSSFEPIIAVRAGTVCGFFISVTAFSGHTDNLFKAMHV